MIIDRTRKVRPSKLLAELIAAIPALAPVNSASPITLSYNDPATALHLTVPNGISVVAVDAVLAAHDPSTPSATEAAAAAQATQDAAAYTDLRNQYQAMITRLEQIQTQMTGSPSAATTRDAVRDLAIGQERVLKAFAVFARGQ